MFVEDWSVWLHRFFYIGNVGHRFIHYVNERECLLGDVRATSGYRRYGMSLVEDLFFRKDVLARGLTQDDTLSYRI